MKSTNQIEGSFRSIEKILDESKLLLQKNHPQFNVEDFSNRSGFDKSGFPYYLWWHIFQHDSSPNPHVERHEIQINYLEPIDEDDRVIKFTVTTEKFNLGQDSFFKESKQHLLEASSITVQKVCSLFDECLTEI